MRGLLKALAIFDWISPLSYAAHRYVGGDAGLVVPESYFKSGRALVKHLKRHGIKARWMGRMVVNGHYMICIPRQDEQRAREIMERS